MSFPWSDVELIIYDLDGTLYEETRHFAYYAELIRDGLPPAHRGEYEKDLERLSSGRHPLTIGRVYDATTDRVLAVDASMRVVRAWRWDGVELSPEKVASAYPHPIHCGMEAPYIAVGDGWWPPVVAAHRRGMTDTRPYYERAKLHLHETPGWLRPIPGLADAIGAARGRVPQVVATNSDREDAEQLLRRLGLSDVVSRLYPSCNKPADAESWFSRICSEWGTRPERTLSVGDNYLNDIIPALRLGMLGALIEGSGLADAPPPNPRLTVIGGAGELIPWLRGLGRTGEDGVEQR